MKREKEISSFIDYMYPESETFEVCVMQSRPGDISTGYYRDKEAAVQAIVEAESRRPYGMFISANPLKESTISGPIDNEQIQGGKRARNEDISRIKRLLIDLDPIRPSNTSATPEQHEASLVLAKKIKGLMSKRKGWPEPAMLDTGNGSMLIYDVDLKNTPENVNLVRGCLDWLDKKFSTDEVKVDTSVGNPGRLIRIPGTKNRKGPSDDAGRPQRRAKLVRLPKNPRLLSEKKMRKITASRSEPSEKKQPLNNSDRTILDVEAYLKAYEVKYLEPKDWHGGKLYPLKACPFDPDDKPGEASIIQDPEGTLYFQCFHRSCKGNKWRDFRKQISKNDKLDIYMIQIKATTKQPSLSLIRADKLVKYTRYEPPLISGILERHGMLLIRGPAGIGKSMLALNVALNIANPPGDNGLWSKFLVMNKARVLIVQSENSRNSLKKRLSKMTKKNPRYEEAMSDIYYLKSKDVCTVSGNLQDELFMKSIKRSIIRKDIGLVIIDPLISYHGEDENNNRGMRQALQVITELCETFKVATILIHHDGKSESSRSKGGRGASSIGDWAPNIIALAEVSKEPHIIKVMHVKGRDFAPFDDFTLRRTEQFDFERYAGKVKESERKESVIKNEKVRVVEDEILQFLGQGKADQKTIIERICRIFKKDNISPQKARKILESMMVERKIKSRREGKRKLYYLRKGGMALSKGKMAEIIDIFAKRKSVAKNNP